MLGCIFVTWSHLKATDEINAKSQFGKNLIYSQSLAAYLLGALILLPDRLLGVLSSIEVNSVQILNTGHQIFQGVTSHLCQGLGLRRRQLESFCLFAHQRPSVFPHSGETGLLQSNKNPQIYKTKKKKNQPKTQVWLQYLRVNSKNARLLYTIQNSNLPMSHQSLCCWPGHRLQQPSAMVGTSSRDLNQPDWAPQGTENIKYKDWATCSLCR